jgi:hypothetical protein
MVRDLDLDHIPPIKGVIYNVVRRPLSGGKGTIKQCKGETREEFYDRLSGYMREDPGHYFSRWKTEVGKHDVRLFRDTCLDPILEALCNWWTLTTGGTLLPAYAMTGHHWRHPYGVVNTIDEYGNSELDENIATGSTAGLVRAETLFTELE